MCPTKYQSNYFQLLRSVSFKTHVFQSFHQNRDIASILKLRLILSYLRFHTRDYSTVCLSFSMEVSIGESTLL